MRRAVLLLGLVAACSEPDFWSFSSRPSTGQGATVVVVWTSDSPVDTAERVWVALESVELDGRVLFAGRRELDYLALRNGRRALLAEAEVPPGTYARLRLRLASLGHRVERDGLVHPLAPERTVVDLAGPFLVRGGERLELNADLNVRMSVVEAGGRWSLDPRFTLTDLLDAVFLEGLVLDPLGEPVAGATASAQEGSQEIASTRTEADGSFRVGPLPRGRYRLVATAPGRAPAVLPAAAPAGNVLTLAEEPSFALAGRTDPAGGLTARLFRDGALLAVAGVDPATGAFRFPDVPAGSYDVEIWGAAGLVAIQRALAAGP